MLRLLLGKSFSDLNLSSESHAKFIESFTEKMDDFFVPTLCEEPRTDGNRSSTRFGGEIIWQGISRIKQVGSARITMRVRRHLDFSVEELLVHVHSILD